MSKKRCCKNCRKYKDCVTCDGESNFKSKQSKYKKLKERIKKLEKSFQTTFVINDKCDVEYKIIGPKLKENKIFPKDYKEVKNNDIELPVKFKSYEHFLSFMHDILDTKDSEFDNFTSEKTYATIKLQWIADQLNGDWKPSSENKGFSFYLENFTNLVSSKDIYLDFGQIRFETVDLLNKVRELMGDDIYYYFGVKNV